MTRKLYVVLYSLCISVVVCAQRTASLPIQSVMASSQTNIRISLANHDVKDYLNNLIWDAEHEPAAVFYQNRFGHIEEQISMDETIHGDDPFFFYQYHHPRAQQMSGFNFGYAGMPIAEEVDDKGEYISLRTVTPEARIYFTTDGTIPNEKSRIYESPVKLKPGMILKAKTIRMDLQHSPVLEYTAEGKQSLAVVERLNEDKIMGAFPIPGTNDVLIKYKTKQPGLIKVALVDQNCNSFMVDIIDAKQAEFGICQISTEQIQTDAYFIKLVFESGKKTYRQMSKSQL